MNLCSLTNEIINNPVIDISTGLIYDKNNIIKNSKSNKVYDKTGNVIDEMNIYPINNPLMNVYIEENSNHLLDYEIKSLDKIIIDKKENLSNINNELSVVLSQQEINNLTIARLIKEKKYLQNNLSNIKDILEHKKNNYYE